MEVIYCNSIDDLPPGCAELFRQAENDSFDLSADWFRLIESGVVSSGIQPRYCILIKDEEVMGVLPLFMKDGAPWRRQVASMTKFYSSLYRPLFSATLNVDELAECLRVIYQDNRTAIFRFDLMDPTHPSFQLLESACFKASLKPYRFFCFGNWYLPVRGRSFDTYFESLPSQIRNTIRRREKKFHAAGGGKLEIVTGGDRLEEIIASWEKIYRASWKKPEPFPEFVPGLIQLCAARGWLRLGMAYYEGEPVAAQLWIVSHGRAVIYKLAYDNNFAKLSAGTVLSAYLMAYVLDVDKVQEVDYLIGDDEYKKDWMSHRRERWGIVAYNPATVRGLLGSAMQMLGEFARKYRGVAKEAEGPAVMKWTLCPVKEFDRHATAWDNLNNLGPKSPLLNSLFLTACIKNFEAEGQCLAILGEVTNPDAMTVLGKRRGIAWDTYQPAQAPIGFWLMRSGLNLEGVLRSLLSALPGFPLVVGVSQQDPLLMPRPMSPKLLSFDYIYTARIVVQGTFEDYFSGRGKNLRQNMRKAKNRLSKAELPYQLQCITDPNKMRDAVEYYGRLESAGWKSQDGTAVHLDNEQGRFYAELLEEFCRAGAGRVYYLTVNDVIVAMDLCVAQDDVLVILKTTYDEKYKEYSPAMLLHLEIFEKLFESREFRCIEFYGKVMEWHRRWTDDVRMMYHVNAYRSPWWKALIGRRVPQEK